MRMLLVGDTHGNDRFFAQMCRLAVAENCDRLVQLGDFGYWEHYTEGKGYLKWCEKQLRENNLECYWLDGNHENHPLLWSAYGPDGRQYKPTKDGFWEIRQGLYYMPRGHRWVWDDVSFLALGGAYSIDKDCRAPGKSWWPTEMISEADIEAAIAGGKVDVMFTHDAPDGGIIPSIKDQPNTMYPESLYNRESLLEVVKAVKPYFLAHGHYHDRYTSHTSFPVGLNEDGTTLLWHKVQIEGLGADMSPFGETSCVFDTETFRAAPRD